MIFKLFLFFYLTFTSFFLFSLNSGENMPDEQQSESEKFEQEKCLKIFSCGKEFIFSHWELFDVSTHCILSEASKSSDQKPNAKNKGRAKKMITRFSPYKGPNKAIIYNKEHSDDKFKVITPSSYMEYNKKK